MISPPDRAAETLAERQAELVRALVSGGPTPSGFDTEAVAAAARALLHKRARDVARRYPQLAHACGDDFTPRFTTWAATVPKTSTATDATAFADHAGLSTTLLGSRRRPLRRWLRQAT
ncbi:hypothetical protein [Nocardia altamirensis]|uniref:hypothetical protein n=1 Tax=Nocardia altamirensis TaxID=472158 RepID=UPI0008408FFA|nr:hypothetical protein [Nocardia altamirensis]